MVVEEDVEIIAVVIEALFGYFVVDVYAATEQEVSETEGLVLDEDLAAVNGLEVDLT